MIHKYQGASMNIFSKVFNKEKINKNRPNQEKEYNPLILDNAIKSEGIGTEKKIIKDVYNEQVELLFIWRERYSENEYPYKVVINLIYQLLQLEYMWKDILNCFKSGIIINDYNSAYQRIMSLKEIAIGNVRDNVENSYKTRDSIGNCDISSLRIMVGKAQNGNEEIVRDIEKYYLWYTGGVELAYHWAACGLMGLSYYKAAIEVCSIFIPTDFNNLIQMQTLLGNNINLMYKPLPSVLNSKREIKKEKFKFNSQKVDNTIRFLNAQIDLVEYRVDGIWMKPIGVHEDSGEIMIAFKPDFQIKYPSYENGVTCIYKKTIDFSFELSKSAYYKVGNYVYPAFDSIDSKEERNNINRILDEELRIQIINFVCYFMDQYIFTRNFFLKNVGENIPIEKLLSATLRLFYEKNSKFNREKYYYETNYYIHPIENEFIEQIIEKSINDFKNLKQTNTCVYEPYGLRDEVELILTFIDNLVFREFLMNHLKNEIEINTYFEFVPNLVEHLYKKMVLDLENLYL